MLSESVDITGLPAGELQKLRESLSEDVQLITNNFGNLKVAQARYTQALEAVTQLSDATGDKTIMVPLTGSLYIPGKLNNVKSVMVDIGTGYFVEKQIPDAKSFINSKLAMLTDNIDKVGIALSGKRRDLEAVTVVLQAKMQAVKQAQDRELSKISA